jgi:malonate transporter and related proteins
MSIATILLPDFALIVIGFFLIRATDWGPAFWTGLERLIYFILFPALLFYSTLRAPLDFASTGKMIQVALLPIISGIALGWLAKLLFRSAPMVFESGVQTAFRFNSYIALAVASRLAGDKGTALMALIIGFAVPICNLAAVHALAHKSGGVIREIIRNPLLMATAGGLLFNLAGLQLPEVGNLLLSRLGNASIALGLIAVGAGLRLTGHSEARGISAYFIAVKLLVLPAITYAAALWMALPPLQMQIVVMFAALPTASSAYVLAVRMGGNGPLVAFLISAGTLLSLFTLPLWLSLVL